MVFPFSMRLYRFMSRKTLSHVQILFLLEGWVRVGSRCWVMGFGFLYSGGCRVES